jgi:hypothetical protein
MDYVVIPLLLSDITWSSSNNVASILGMDGTVNFLFALFGGNIGHYFDSFFSGVSAKRGNGFAFRRDGGIARLFGTGLRAITFQHFMFSTDDQMEILEYVSVFVPDASLSFSHYGTLLLLTPDGSTPFLLRGSSRENLGGGSVAPAARGWTRGGGTAEPVYPGSTVPSFPSGGLHIDRTLKDPRWQNSSLSSVSIKGPVGCQLSELSATGAFLMGVSRPALLQLVIHATGLNLGGATVLVTDGSTSVAIAKVLSAIESTAGGGRSAPRVKITTVLLDTNAGFTSPARLRGLTPVPPTETLAVVASQPGYLSTASSANNYAAGDPLRLSQTGAVVGSALIQRLEAQIQIDASLANNLGAFTVNRASAVPPATPSNATVGSPTTLNVKAADPMPGVNTPIRVFNAAGTLAVIASNPQPTAGGATGDTAYTLDRALPAAITGAVQWEPIVIAEQIGGNTGYTAGSSTLTYVPQAVRTVPAGNFVTISSGGTLAVRAVTAANYDALVLGAALPGNAALPFSVERFRVSGADQPNCIVQSAGGVGFDPALNPGFDPTKVTGTAMRIVEFAGTSVAQVAASASTVSVGLPAPMTVNGSTLTLSLTTLNSSWPAPSPGQLMLLQDAAALQSELTVATSLTLTAPIDRPWLGAASGLAAVPLVDGSPAYDAALSPLPVTTPFTITLANTVLAGLLGTVTVEMPRFAAGEIVKLAWTKPAPGNELYTVVSVEVLTSGGQVLVDGTVLTLDGGPVPPASSSSFTVTRQVASDPLTGGTRDGINGSTTNLAGNPALQFNVWRPATLLPASTAFLPALNGYAITDGKIARPVRFLPLAPATPRTLTIQLGGPLQTITAPTVNLFMPAHAPIPPPVPGKPSPGFSGALSTSFSFQPPNHFTYSIHPDDQQFVVNTPTGNLLVAQFYAAASGAVTGSGTLDTGTVLIPEEPSIELTTKEGVIEHEMRHTWQSQAWGPLLFCILPTLPFVEKVFPGFGLPGYSAYFPVTVKRQADGSRTLHCNDSSVALAKGDTVEIGAGHLFQLSDAGVGGDLTLGKGDDDGNTLEDATTLYARKQTDAGALGVVGRIFNTLTIGGVLELLIVGTWGQLIYWGARGIYVLAHLGSNAGKTYPAKIDKGATTLTLSDDAGKAALKDAAKVIIKNSDYMTVRDVSSVDDATLTISSAIPDDKTGDIQVAPYSTHTPASSWDWHSYYPATIPDSSKSATIKISPAGKDTLKLAVNDEVIIRDGTQDSHTYVTAVNGDGTLVDLKDRPIVKIGGTPDPSEPVEFQIAKIGSDDPVGSLGSLIARKMGAGWVRYMIDPFAAVMDALPTKQGSFWNWLARVVRWICSTRSWSVPAGWWVIDNLPHQVAKNGWFAQMEQDASVNSGDLYSSLGKLPDAPSLVGDIGRYYLWGDGRFGTEYGVGQLDSPGPHLPQKTCLLPFVTGELPPPPVPPPVNNGATAKPLAAGAPFAGDAVPDALAQKAFGDPRTPTLVTPAGFGSATAGFIPMTPRLERTAGAYVAFTQPGAHRISCQDGVLGDDANARQVQDQGAGPFAKMSVPIFFNQTVADLTAVTMAGQSVTNGATITLVLTQRAPINVQPRVIRNYALTIPAPQTDTMLRASDATTLTVQKTLDPKPSRPVELCRIYRFDSSTQKYDDAVLNHSGVHLARDLRIPVRRFTISVTDKIDARKALSAKPEDDIASVQPGQDAWVLVPAAILMPLAVTVSYTPPLALPHQDPAPTISPATIPDALKEAAGDGGGFQIHFAADDPPEQAATLALSVEVGTAGNSASLTGSLTLNPWFVLNASSFNVAPGGTLTLNAVDLSSAPFNVDTVSSIAGATVTTQGATITIKVDLGATPGTRRVLAWLAASPDKKGARTITIG